MSLTPKQLLDKETIEKIDEHSKKLEIQAAKDRRKRNWEKEKNRGKKKITKVRGPAKKRKPKKQSRIPQSYNKYIDSHWWVKRRNAFWEKYYRVCCACGSSKEITLHHAIYERYYYEYDKHLYPLCWGCHKQFHQQYPITKKNMRTETNRFIFETRSYFGIPKNRAFRIKKRKLSKKQIDQLRSEDKELYKRFFSH